MKNTVVLASGNQKKLNELNTLLAAFNCNCVSQQHYNVAEVPEDGLSFVENALIKARNACRHTGLPSIADDSGLEVPGLNGAPGIYSARYAGTNATDSQNVDKLLTELSNNPHIDRRARFVCALVFMRHELDPVPEICVGTWDGSILQAPIGDNGFGYDPVFCYANDGHSAAELASDEKNKISHRAKAIKSLGESFSRNGIFSC